MAWPENVDDSQIRIDWFSGSGGGGQNRNKNQNCCRMTHLPTGIQAASQDQKSREQNKRIAFKRLADKLAPLMRRAILEAQGKLPEPCKDRIRTYHEKRGTVVDHRVPERTFNYSRVLDGDLNPLIKAVQEKRAEEQIEEMADE